MTGIDACRYGWVAVSLADGSFTNITVGSTLAALRVEGEITGIDMPLGLLESGWRTADQQARQRLGPRRSSVFAIPPRAVWAQETYATANKLCRQLTGQGLSAQTWGLRVRLLEADEYRKTCEHPLYEVHPELAFSAMAGAPLPASKHSPEGRARRREVLARAGIVIPSGHAAPITDLLDAAAVAWSAHRIATGAAVTVPDQAQFDDHGYQITIRY